MGDDRMDRAAEGGKRRQTLRAHRLGRRGQHRHAVRAVDQHGLAPPHRRGGAFDGLEEGKTGAQFGFLGGGRAVRWSARHSLPGALPIR